MIILHSFFLFFWLFRQLKDQIDIGNTLTREGEFNQKNPKLAKEFIECY